MAVRKCQLHHAWWNSTETAAMVWEKQETLLGIRRGIKRVLGLDNRRNLPNPFRDGTGNNRVVIHHRSGNRSDRNTIDQIFIQRDYALGKLKRGGELYKF